jgi:acyl transferase domain-containing protein
MKLADQVRIFNGAGKTFAFDHRAESGFARGEGVACLVLKPLEQAIKDRDKIRSVIVNTGTNHDGWTVGKSAHLAEAKPAGVSAKVSHVFRSPTVTPKSNS